VFHIATHLAGLVEDLLDVSRIEQGRMSMDLEELSPEEIVSEVVEQLHFEAEKKGLAFDYRKPAQPLPLIKVDKSRLKQVLINLCSNAIKYTPKGSVTVTTELDEENRVEIKITDTGLGMSAEAREKLFQKFYRVKTDDTRDIPGTGLGLWITKQIVELMSGKIYVDSIEKIGTQASVTFPHSKPAPVSGTPVGTAAVPSGAGGSDGTAPAAGGVNPPMAAAGPADVPAPDPAPEKKDGNPMDKPI
jgi:signal transduction histidine kinase